MHYGSLVWDYPRYFMICVAEVFIEEFCDTWLFVIGKYVRVRDVANKGIQKVFVLSHGFFFREQFYIYISVRK